MHMGHTYMTAEMHMYNGEWKIFSHRYVPD